MLWENLEIPGHKLWKLMEYYAALSILIMILSKIIFDLGWIWIKSGRDKNLRTRPQIGPNVHHTDEKLKDQKETNRQTDRIR
jgi:hypothetical protein